MAAQAASLRHEVLDDFGPAAAWKASASDQVRASLRRDADGSLCLDYDFAGVSGYAVMRRERPVSWPAHFDLVARLKSTGAVNDFQFKLVDASGDNVWWVNRPNATGQALPRTLDDIRIRRRHIDFAWGPGNDRQLRQTQFVEWVVAAGREGGKGSLCVARLALVERTPDPAVWPVPQRAVRAGALHLDLGASREFNGLALRWPAGARRLSYDVAASQDGRAWRTLRRVRGSDGGLDALFLPESEARHLRIGLPRGVAAPAVDLRSAAQWPQLNAVLSSLAADLPRGDLPRAYVGEQNYWTLVGVDGGGDRSGLLSEDGAIELGRGGFSVEPSVQLADGRRITWADVQQRHSLPEGHLPLPRVHWRHEAFALDVQAAAEGPAEAPQLLARYTLRNTGGAAADLHADAGPAALAGEPAATVPQHARRHQPGAGVALGRADPGRRPTHGLALHRHTAARHRLAAGWGPRWRRWPLHPGCVCCRTRRPWPRRRCSFASAWPRAPAIRWVGPLRWRAPTRGRARTWMP